MIIYSMQYSNSKIALIHVAFGHDINLFLGHDIRFLITFRGKNPDIKGHFVASDLKLNITLKEGVECNTIIKRSMNYMLFYLFSII